MPKKRSRNGFYYYMLDFKEEQRKKGIHYADMNELEAAANPSWREVPPSVRSEFEAIAKKKKEKTVYVEKKYTSTGVSLDMIEKEKKEALETMAAERKNIQDLIQKALADGSILTQYLYIIDVNYYFKVSNEYVIAEMSIIRVNLKEGVIDHKHKNINPGTMTGGYLSDMILGCERLGLPVPYSDQALTDYMQILFELKNFLSYKNDNKHLIMFTMPNKVEAVQNFIMQMCYMASVDDRIFHVYNLNTLFFDLINALKTEDSQGYPVESVTDTLRLLEIDFFKYWSNISCQHHKPKDKTEECTLSRVHRWAYTIFKECCMIAGIEKIPYKHMPISQFTDEFASTSCSSSSASD